MGDGWHIRPSGTLPIWSRDGRELLFQTDVRVMTVSFSTKGESFAAGKPRLWTDARVFAPQGSSYYDLAPDTKRLATMVADEQGAGKPPTHLTFLLNFFDELRRRAPGK